MKAKVGLVLTGGGARGAYQAGVLLGISEMMSKQEFPFPIITGISAGSINAAFLACSQGSFHESAEKLWDIWWNLKSTEIFRQSKIGFASMAVRALINIFFGGALKPKWPDSLLDSLPLQGLLDRTIDLRALDERISIGHLHGVCFSATDFSSKTSMSFFQAHPDIKPWVGKERLGIRTHLSTQHIMASAAIPGIFKLIEIAGSYYGDGSTRVAFPVAPAIRLGAEKILAIDMRFPQSVFEKRATRPLHYPPLDEIFASLLDSIFSDSLDRDLERLALVNTIVKNAPHENPRWRSIQTMLIRPSQNLGALADDIFDSLSLPLRRILSVLGISSRRSTELVSHLAFEQCYTQRLLQLGRSDALSYKTDLLQFLELGSG